MSAKHLLSFKKTVTQVATLFQGVSLKLLKLKRYKIQISSKEVIPYKLKYFHENKNILNYEKSENITAVDKYKFFQ